MTTAARSFQIDGFTYEGQQFFAFPEAGSFFGLSQVREGEGDTEQRLLQVAMLTNGFPDMEGPSVPNLVEVTNMGEPGDGHLLSKINRRLGSRFRLSDFAGR